MWDDARTKADEKIVISQPAGQKSHGSLMDLKLQRDRLEERTVRGLADYLRITNRSGVFKWWSPADATLTE